MNLSIGWCAKKRRRKGSNLESNELVWYVSFMEVNIYEAKSKLSQLVERARLGEEIVIAKAGKRLQNWGYATVPSSVS